MIIAGTGHRPENAEPEEFVRTKVLNKLKELEVEKVITGMAAGFDLWFADVALELGIPVVAARPWSTHTWRDEDEDLYKKILENAVEVVDVVKTDRFPGNWVYQRRNEWMVDNATHVLAYIKPGTEKGGTFNCVTYADGKKPIAYLWNDPPF